MAMCSVLKKDNPADKGENGHKGRVDDNKRPDRVDMPGSYQHSAYHKRQDQPACHAKDPAREKRAKHIYGRRPGAARTYGEQKEYGQSAGNVPSMCCVSH